MTCVFNIEKKQSFVPLHLWGRSRRLCSSEILKWHFSMLWSMLLRVLSRRDLTLCELVKNNFGVLLKINDLTEMSRDTLKSHCKRLEHTEDWHRQCKIDWGHLKPSSCSPLIRATSSESVSWRYRIVPGCKDYRQSDRIIPCKHLLVLHLYLRQIISSPRSCGWFNVLTPIIH